MATEGCDAHEVETEIVRREDQVWSCSFAAAPIMSKLATEYCDLAGSSSRGSAQASLSSPTTGLC